MLTERIKSVCLAIIVHLLILLAISQTVLIPQHQIKPEPKAIKSFIYTPKPATPPEPKPVELEVLPERDIVKTSPEQQEKIVNKEKNQAEIPPVKEVDAVEKVEVADNSKEFPSNIKTKRAPTPFSPTQQLDNLRQSLNDKIFAEQDYQFNRPNTGSIMHGKPTLVPHSKRQFTEEEKKKQASHQISSDINMIKGDDGRCYIERDLTSVGMAGVTSSESFDCGKSKFDKSFKAHMQKVREKLGK